MAVENSTDHYLGAAGASALGEVGDRSATWAISMPRATLTLVDRRTDLVSSGGANIDPAEVEAALVIAHPDGRPLGRRDRPARRATSAIEVHAIVQLSDASRRARLYRRRGARGPSSATRLARYKVPRSFEFVDEPLRDDAGKTRSALREARIQAAGTGPGGEAQAALSCSAVFVTIGRRPLNLSGPIGLRPRHDTRRGSHRES
jgi:bile acid-coenzyme A ligase